MLVSRFLLDLQGANQKAAQGLARWSDGGSGHLPTLSSGATSTIMFERVVGSIASSITPVDSEVGGYDEEVETDVEDKLEMSDRSSPVTPVSRTTMNEQHALGQHERTQARPIGDKEANTEV